MATNIILGKIKDGSIRIQRFFKKDLVKWEGKEIEIHLVQGGKSQAQLGYLWGVVFPIVAQGIAELDTNEVYQTYVDKFSTYWKTIKGKNYKFRKGLSEMKVGEASEFINKVVTHARTELGMIIPEPDDDFKYGD